jgi:hypothetical protein
VEAAGPAVVLGAVPGAGGTAGSLGCVHILISAPKRFLLDRRLKIEIGTRPLFFRADDTTGSQIIVPGDD